MYSMPNIVILGKLYSYLIGFYIVNWKILEQLPRCLYGPTIQVARQGFLVIWGLFLVFLGITGTVVTRLLNRSFKTINLLCPPFHEYETEWASSQPYSSFQKQNGCLEARMMCWAGWPWSLVSTRSKPGPGPRQSFLSLFTVHWHLFFPTSLWHIFQRGTWKQQRAAVFDGLKPLCLLCTRAKTRL